MAQVEIRVKSGLEQILKDLESLRARAEDVSAALRDTGNQTSESIKKNTRETETFFGQLRTFGRRMSDQLKRDFAALASLESLAAGLKISEQFKNSVKESVILSDSIRRLGPVFGMVEKDFVGFQKTLTDGLGEIGLSSEAASRTLEGLSQTQVRGEENILGYARAAGQLATIGGEQGREGDIARGMASVIRARGGDVNNKKEMEALAESLRRVFLSTGVGPSQALDTMTSLFEQMPADFRKAITSSGLANLAAAQAVGGPATTQFLEEYLGKSPIARMAFEAQGGRGIFTEEGIDIEKFRAFAGSIMGRVGGDPRLAAQTLGLSEDAAEGFVRLAESLDRVKEAQDRIQRTTGNLNETYRQSMSLGDSFRANINRIKSFLAEPLASITQGATNLLNQASQSDLGAGAVVAGGGLLAALLAGGGLRGIGGSLVGTVLKSQAAEQLTGQKTIPVYVTNAAEIGAAGAASGLLSGGAGGVMGFLGKAGAVGAALGAGVLAGQLAEPYVGKFLEDKTTGTTKEGFTGDIVERLFFKLDMLLGGDTTSAYRAPAPPQKVKVEFNTPLLKETKQPTRGASN